MLLAHVLCHARVLLWQMVKPGDLLEPTSEAHLAKLTPRGRVGTPMSTQDRRDPAKAKYMGQCCGGTRVWGDGNAAVFTDACGSCPFPACLAFPLCTRRMPRADERCPLTAACPQEAQRFCGLRMRRLQAAAATADPVAAVPVSICTGFFWRTAESNSEGGKS